MPFAPTSSFPKAATGGIHLGEITMSKLVIRVAGASLASALACGLATSANAQLVTHKDISLPIAVAMAQTAIATCKANGYNVSANVVGRGGEVIVAMRGDATGPHTLENSMKKAYTAKAQRRPSGEFAEGIKTNFTAGALRLSNIVPAQGALPIKVGEDTIGAIGVSGAPGGDKDEACAKAGIEKVAAELK
jgi:uncharacterized protein GlcG (DUF336 family)